MTTTKNCGNDEWGSATDVAGKESDSYKIFGKCFERNLRFAMENDPELIAGGGGGGGRGEGGAEEKVVERITILSNTKSTTTQVNEFYEYWIHFES